MYDPALSRVVDRLRFDLDDTAGPAIDATPGEETDALLLAEMLPDATYEGQLGHNGNDYDRTLYALAKHLMLHYANEPQRMAVAGKVEADWAARFSAWRDIVTRAAARADTAEQQYSSGFRVLRTERPTTLRGEYNRLER
jgi:hypothetical protein